ncbi:hypothetical protein F5Y05DRAFT_14860 [Hypoxylon sp. FL0543]|nr:hypothetical protein F5Y05DRAFT_14860 [Hypoxylon sp. FL0543]
MEPDSLTCSSSAVVVSVLCSRNVIGQVTHQHVRSTRRFGWPWAAHGMVQSPPQLFGITKGSMVALAFDLRPLANRKLQIVPNSSLGPTGTKAQEPK